MRINNKDFDKSKIKSLAIKVLTDELIVNDNLKCIIQFDEFTNDLNECEDLMNEIAIEWEHQNSSYTHIIVNVHDSKYNFEPALIIMKKEYYDWLVTE